MAASLSTTLLSNPLQPYRNTIQNSLHFPSTLLPIQNLNLPVGIKYPKNLLIFSPRTHTLTVASAVSGSADVESSLVGDDTKSLLDTVKVFDLKGNDVSISDIWKDRKAVVAFARHFGCLLCRKRADYLASKKDVMDAAGVTLVLIGPGSVDQANAFAEQTKFQGEIYADPTHSSYEAFKFVSGVSTIFTPKAGLKLIQSYMEGYRQDWKLSFEKDTVSRGGWQQGGIIVAGPGKSTISYIHKDKEAGDDPDIGDILKACCS
ncbi:hypothetical protein L6164_033616 [Bauhinia variegata]|uniref:Uncharacterized protein n=1 Tax=Bauhinia variegata TaxID=167791 RepID=A0ACB9KSD8_BAUVA|nr:hypothetical protein L6164_033616 [Bauhinia variegata]